MKPVLATSTGRSVPGFAVGTTAGARRTLGEWLRTSGGRVALGGVLFFAAYAVWLFSGATPDNRILAADLWNLPLVAAGGVAAWMTSRLDGLEPRLRRAWQLSALAFFCYTAGNTWWFIDENVFGELPLVSWSDAVYLAYYPLLFAGLLSFPTVQRTRAEAIRLLLDGGTVLLSAGAVIWYIVLGPSLKAATTTPLETVLTVAYPVADVVLLFGCVLALHYRPAPSSRRSLWLLVVGGIMVFLADLGYGHVVLRDGEYLSGQPLDFGWQLAALFWFVAAQYQRFSIGRRSTTVRDTEPHYTGVSLLPYVALAAGFALLVDTARPAWSESLTVVIGTVFLLSAIVVARQILAMREIERLVTERSAREARFRSMVQHSSDVISVVDRTGALRFVSPAVGRVFRWHADALVGTDIASIIHPDDLASARVFLKRMSEQPGATSSFVCRLRDGDGNWRHVESMCTSHLDDPTVSGLVLNTRDVSDRTRLEAELTRRAYNDPLTGLANRVRFHAMTEQALKRSKRHPARVAVLFLDLDNFKTVNDSLGHLLGDQLLIEFAARLLNATRGCDTVARLGGDEFAVLLDSIAREEDAIVVAQRIDQSMERPFRLGPTELVLGSSIGIAHASADVTADELLRDADVAMYVAKRDGKGRYTVFEPAMQLAVRDHQELESDLRLALDRREFRLVFQPIIDLVDGRIAGAEALLRWQHPVRGLLAPDAFIGTAMESGLIVPIGHMVLNMACQRLANWHRTEPHFAEFTLSVNVAGRQFQTDSFPTDVAAALESSGVPGRNLILEITEGEIMKETFATLERLHALKALGVRIAIDDFGTGYSSLSCLQRFPVDVLKIDKTFIDQVAFEGHGQALTRMIMALGETLGLRTIAEGVEDPRQAETLRAMRCDFAQGYLYSPPVEADAFAALLSEAGGGCIRRLSPPAVPVGSSTACGEAGGAPV
ncbi:MAG TPA: EAL domain-containing protein [Gemmatimonadaceae bacterium]